MIKFRMVGMAMAIAAAFAAGYVVARQQGRQAEAQKLGYVYSCAVTSAPKVILAADNGNQPLMAIFRTALEARLSTALERPWKDSNDDAEWVSAYMVARAPKWRGDFPKNMGATEQDEMVRFLLGRLALIAPGAQYCQLDELRALEQLPGEALERNRQHIAEVLTPLAKENGYDSHHRQYVYEFLARTAGQKWSRELALGHLFGLDIRTRPAPKSEMYFFALASEYADHHDQLVATQISDLIPICERVVTDPEKHLGSSPEARCALEYYLRWLERLKALRTSMSAAPQAVPPAESTPAASATADE